MTNIELMYFVFALNVIVITLTYCKFDFLGFSTITSLMHGKDTVKGSLGAIGTRCGDYTSVYAGMSCIITVGITMYEYQWVWLVLGILAIINSYRTIIDSTTCLSDNMEFLRKGYAAIKGMRNVKIILIPSGMIKWLYLINLAFMLIQVLRSILL